MPNLENAVRTDIVSSSDRPNPPATEPPCCNAIPRSATSADDALAAAANRSATCPALSADRPNMFIAAV